MPRIARPLLLALAALGLALTHSTSTFAAEPSLAKAAVKPAKKDRVVVQMSDADPKKWNLALNNVRNLQADLGKDRVDLEIVAYGPGIDMLKAESEVGNRIDEALEAGVKVVACENTMRAQKLGKDDMLPHISYVPAGVVELMRKQQQGWAYLRP